MDIRTAPFGRRLARDDEGLGLVEIVVAMFVLALIAMSLLPLLITGMKASARNATIAAATQFANDRVNLAQAAGRSSSTPCSAISALAATPSTMVDGRGVELVATTTVGSCPVGIGTITVATSVRRSDTGAVVASTSTAVLVVP